MGRKPVGERAMTPAERQRRYRDARAARTGQQPTADKAQAARRKVAALEAEGARLLERLTRVADLESALARTQQHTVKLEAEVERLRMEKPRPSPDSELSAENRNLKARLQKLEAAQRAELLRSR